MSDKLISLYTDILDFAGMSVDERGYVWFDVNDSKKPCVVDGAHWVLPLPEHLRNYNREEKMIFHPLTENIMRGESEVIQKLKNVINMQLNLRVGHIAQKLLELVSSPAQHKSLDPEQSQLLYKVKEADKTTVVNFTNQWAKFTHAHADKVFCNIYLRRGGVVKKQKYSRAGIVSFPFYENLITDKIEGIRVKDKETFKQIIEYIFPDIDEAESYNFGSDSRVAPFLEELMRTAANLAARVNDVLLMFKDYIPDASKYLFNDNWMDDFQNLDELKSEIRKIPVQYGNDGTIEPQQLDVPVAAATAQAYQNAPTTAQTSSGKPEPKITKEGIDFKDFMQGAVGAMAANPAQQNWAPNPMAQQGMNPNMPVATVQGIMPLGQAMQMGLMWQPVQQPVQQNWPQQPMMPNQGVMVQQGWPQQPMMPNQGVMMQQPMQQGWQQQQMMYNQMNQQRAMSPQAAAWPGNPMR